MAPSPSSVFTYTLQEHNALFQALSCLAPQTATLAARIDQCLHNGGKLLVFGNGGSAADAQHMASELVGRFQKDRKGLAAIALITDPSILTSVGNDYGFNAVFARQIEALAHPHDVVLGISTSGNSENVLAAFRAAQQIGCECWCLAGRDGGKAREVLQEQCLVVAHQITARIQEAHIFLIHAICQIVENSFAD